MSWSIYVKAAKGIAVKRVTDSQCSASFPEEEKQQFERAKAVILSELANISDKDGVSVEAGGSMAVNLPTADKPREIAWSNLKIIVEPIRFEGMVAEQLPASTN